MQKNRYKKRATTATAGASVISKNRVFCVIFCFRKNEKFIIGICLDVKNINIHTKKNWQTWKYASEVRKKNLHNANSQWHNWSSCAIFFLALALSRGFCHYYWIVLFICFSFVQCCLNSKKFFFFFFLLYLLLLLVVRLRCMINKFKIISETYVASQSDHSNCIEFIKYIEMQM